MYSIVPYSSVGTAWGHCYLETSVWLLEFQDHPKGSTPKIWLWRNIGSKLSAIKQITRLLAHELMLRLLVDLVPKCLEANLAPRETPKSLDRDARAKNRCSNIFE